MTTETFAHVADSFARQGLMQTLGARLVHVAAGEVQILLPFSASLSQQQGFVHAGAVTSVVDSACGYAALTRAPAGHEVVTAEFKINFMRPAIGSRFLALGRVQSAGRLLSVCTGEVRAYTEAAAGVDDQALVGAELPYKVVALMQATMVFVAP